MKLFLHSYILFFSLPFSSSKMFNWRALMKVVVRFFKFWLHSEVKKPFLIFLGIELFVWKIIKCNCHYFLNIAKNFSKVPFLTVFYRYKPILPDVGLRCTLLYCVAHALPHLKKISARTLIFGWSHLHFSIYSSFFWSIKSFFSHPNDYCRYLALKL